MLDEIDLDKKLSKSEYRRRLGIASHRLFDLHRTCWQNDISAIIAIEGWAGSRRGRLAESVTERLDPRALRLYHVQPPRTLERQMPWLRRFWLRIPSYGKMAIFSGSWYRRVLVDRVEQLVGEEEWRQAYDDIVNFERMLAEDGMAVIKFFVHISRGKQTKRLHKMHADPLAYGMDRDADWRQLHRRKKYEAAVEEMFDRTDSEWGPWTVVEGSDRRWATMRVMDTLVHRLSGLLDARGIEVPNHIGSPITDESPAINGSPITDESPAINESPITDESSAINESPITDESPANNESPITNESPTPSMP